MKDHQDKANETRKLEASRMKKLNAIVKAVAPKEDGFFKRSIRNHQATNPKK